MKGKKRQIEKVKVERENDDESSVIKGRDKKSVLGKYNRRNR